MEPDLEAYLEDVSSYVEANEDGILEDLFELLSTPSISATGEGIEACVELADRLCVAYGFDETRVVETEDHPMLIARAFVDGDPNNDRPTILIYGHFDVQPVEPSEWTSPPFEPTIRAGPDGSPRIYARGAGDNKGQWFAHLCAVRALRDRGDLPANITLLLEGEEETGSPHILEVVQGNSELLAADLFYTADGPIDEIGQPIVMAGSRGLLYFEIEARGADRDLHSGNFGGPIPNPAWALVHLLGTMKDRDGRITVDGFYDDVRELTDTDRAILADIPFDPKLIKDRLGIEAFAPGPGESYAEQLMYHPTMNIAGFTAGYGGEGQKTVLPSRGIVKLGCRLVPEQDPDALFELIERHVRSNTPDSVRFEVRKLGTVKPHRTPLDAPYTDTLVTAVSEGWGKEAILKPTIGASGPKYVFAEVLDVPVYIIPYANADENNHGPDENLELECFRRGVRTTASILWHVAAANA